MLMSMIVYDFLWYVFFFQVPYFICEKVPLLADIVIYKGQFLYPVY